MGCLFSSSSNKVHGLDDAVQVRAKSEPTETRRGSKSSEEIGGTFKWVEPHSSVFEAENWKKLIGSLMRNAQVNAYAHSKSRKQFRDTFELRAFVQSCPHGLDDFEKAWIGFVWITHNIEYDMDLWDKDDLKSMSLDEVLERGKCVCDGYSNMYRYFCHSAGLECEKVNGYSKGHGYQIGQRFSKPDHSWNRVRINGRWFLVDCTWGAGKINDDSAFVARFEPYYFLTPPQIFIYDHFPLEKWHQMLDQPIVLEQFESMAPLGLNYSLLDLKCLSHPHNSTHIVTKNDALVMEYRVPSANRLLPRLYLNKEELKNCVFIQRDVKNEKAAILVYLDQQEVEYKFTLYSDGYNDLGTKTICEISHFVKRTGSKKSNSMPAYDLTFGDLCNIECISHKSIQITSDSHQVAIEFKVPKKYKIWPRLYERLDEAEDNELTKHYVYTQHDSKSDRVAVIALLNKRHFDYKLKILSNSLDNLDSYSKSIEFILRRSGSKDLTESPKYDLVFGQKYMLRCTSHQSAFINTKDSQISMEFVYIRDHFLRAHLYDVATGEEHEQATFCQINAANNIIQLLLALPYKHKNYHLSIDYGSANNCYEGYASFLISAFGASSGNFTPDFKYVDLKLYEDLETPVYLHEPLSQRLRCKQSISFKVTAQSVEAIWLECSAAQSPDQEPERIDLERNDNEPSVWFLSTVFDKKSRVVLNVSQRNPNGSLYIYHYCEYDVD